MDDRQLAHKDSEGSEYVWERSGNYKRLVKVEPGRAGGLIAILRSLFGRR